MRKVVRSDRFAIAFDTDFDGVIEGCATPGAGRDKTWINGPIRQLYRTLFGRGFVHTVEAWQNGALVGGLYGLTIGGAFFGESMFHRETDASKVCLIHLAAALVGCGFTLLDAQFVTPHLMTLGAVEIPRGAYHARLAAAISRRTRPLPHGPSAVAGGAGALMTLDVARSHLEEWPEGSLPPNSLV